MANAALAGLDVDIEHSLQAPRPGQISSFTAPCASHAMTVTTDWPGSVTAQSAAFFLSRKKQRGHDCYQVGDGEDAR